MHLLRLLSVGSLALGLLVAPLAPEAQETGRVYRIGYLSGGATHDVPFGPSLQELGYVEGRNLVVERRYAAGHLGELPRLVSELLGLNVDLIVTQGTPATNAAKGAHDTNRLHASCRSRANGACGQPGTPGREPYGLYRWQIRRQAAGDPEGSPRTFRYRSPESVPRFGVCFRTAPFSPPVSRAGVGRSATSTPKPSSAPRSLGKPFRIASS